MKALHQNQNKDTNIQLTRETLKTTWETHYLLSKFKTMKTKKQNSNKKLNPWQLMELNRIEKRLTTVVFTRNQRCMDIKESKISIMVLLVHRHLNLERFLQVLILIILQEWILVLQFLQIRWLIQEQNKVPEIYLCPNFHKIKL